MKQPQTSTDPNVSPEWFEAYGNFILAAILIGAFLWRLRAAWGTFFNPDEALHVLAANQSSLAAAYRASLDTAHPPLLLFVLNLWRVFGTSELIFRLPSIIAGTVFCWIFFLWLRDVFDLETAWAGLILASFLPPLIDLSAEVRQYALLLCFLMLSAYFLERALAADSTAMMFLALLSLCLAMLTHFSAILFAAAIGIYGFLRLLRLRGRRLFAISATGMACAAGLFFFLYRTHISALQGSDVERRMMEQLLSRSYFHWSHDHLLVFALARTFGVCQWAFGQLAVGDVAGLAFFAGVILLLRTRSEQARPPLRLVGIFLLLPFAINCAAAVADVYPYGGTRHSAFLAPFVLAGVAVCLARLFQGHALRGLSAAVVIVAACQSFGIPHRPYMLRSEQRSANMTNAIAAIRRQASPAGIIFVDFQTYFMVRYYLCPEVATAWDSSVPGFRSFPCAGYKVISTEPDINIFSAATFLPGWERMISAYQLKPGQAVWIFQAGWDIGLALQLRKDFPQFNDLGGQSFGRNISLFKLTVGQAMSAGQSRLDSAASVVAKSQSSKGTTGATMSPRISISSLRQPKTSST